MTAAEAEAAVPGFESFPVAYSIKFESGHWEQSETSGGQTSLGSNGTHSADAHTLKINEPCCGDSAFDYTLSGDVLTLRWKDADPKDCKQAMDCLAGFQVFEAAP